MNKKKNRGLIGSKDGGDENASGGDGDFDKEEERAAEPHKNTNTNTQYKKTDDC